MVVARNPGAGARWSVSSPATTSEGDAFVSKERFTRGATRVIGMCALLVVCGLEPLGGQVGKPRPTIGLALSGGNAKAFSHVGVLRVLEQTGVNVDVVTGTSMGAILGVLYATGSTPDQLERFVVEQDWERLLSDADESLKPTVGGALPQPSLVVLPVRGGLPRLPSGIAEGQRFAELLTRVTWPIQTVRDFRKLPIPFAAVATDLETGGAVRLERGSIADVLRATAAIPSVFAPVVIDGRLLADGGLARNIPAEDARALGADVVICSDVSDILEPADSLLSFVALLNQTIAFRMTESNAEQRRLCDVLIRPDIDGIPSTAVERAPEWIARGEAAAREALPELQMLAAPAASRPPRTRLQLDSVYIQAVEFEGLTRIHPGAVRSLFDLRAPAWITPQHVERAVERVFATGLFAMVRYRLESRAGGTTVLVVVFDDRSRDALGFGFRYESRYKGSVFFGATVYNLLRQGSTARVDLRMGEQAHVAAHYVYRFGPQYRFTTGLGASYSRVPFDFYRLGDRIGSRRVDVLNLTARAGFDIGRSVVVGVEVNGEHARGDATGIAAGGDTPHRTFYTVAAIARVNTYGRSFFPDRGLAVLVKSEWAGRVIGGNASFAQYVLQVQGHAPVAPSFAAFGGISVGATAGPDRPPHRAFYLGGSNEYYLFPDRHIQFLGLEPQQTSARYVQAIHAGIQHEPFDDVFVQFRWNGGTTLDRWLVDLDRFINGYGLVLGAHTVIGQVRLTAAGRDFVSWPDVEIDVGYRF